MTPTVPGSLVIYAAGVDWLGQDSSTTATLPQGYTKLAAFSDKGESTLDFQWTSQMVGWQIVQTTDTTGPLTGQFDGGVTGVPWAIALAHPTRALTSASRLRDRPTTAPRSDPACTYRCRVRGPRD